MHLVIGWIVAVLLGVGLAAGATAGVVHVGTKAPAVGKTFVPYGSR